MVVVMGAGMGIMLTQWYASRVKNNQKGSGHMVEGGEE